MKKFALSLVALAPVAGLASAGGEQCSSALSEATQTEVRKVFAQLLDEVSCTDACAEACTDECMDAAVVKMSHEKAAYEKKKKQKVAQASYDKKAAKKKMYWSTPQGTLAAKMSESPAVRGYVGDLICEAFLGEEASIPQRAQLVKMLATDKSESSAELASALYEKAPERFTTTDLLVLAEHGYERFWKPVKKLAMASCETEHVGDVRPAAMLAFEGVDYGKPALKRALKRDIAVDNVASAMIAAAGLEELGYEGALEKTRSRVRGAVLAALDEGNTNLARDLALRAEFVEKQLDQEWVSLSGIESGAAWHCATKRAELAQADEIFELIERISPM